MWPFKKKNTDLANYPIYRVYPYMNVFGLDRKLSSTSLWSNLGMFPSHKDVLDRLSAHLQDDEWR